MVRLKEYIIELQEDNKKLNNLLELEREKSSKANDSLLSLYQQLNKSNKQQLDQITQLNDIQNKKKPGNKYKKIAISSTVRNAVWNKYYKGITEGHCQCCFSMTIYFGNFDCGHITSEKNNGPVTLDNLRPICRTCNSSMKTKNMDDFMKDHGFDILQKEYNENKNK